MLDEVAADVPFGLDNVTAALIGAGNDGTIPARILARVSRPEPTVVPMRLSLTVAASAFDGVVPM